MEPADSIQPNDTLAPLELDGLGVVFDDEQDREELVPVKATRRAAAYDVKAPENFRVKRGRRELVNLRFRAIIPENCYGDLRARSGLSLFKGLDVAAGVIDNDYTGKVCVILVNNGKQDVSFKRGERIAQIIIQKIHTAETLSAHVIQPSDEHAYRTPSERGEKGFHSTGN